MMVVKVENEMVGIKDQSDPDAWKMWMCDHTRVVQAWKMPGDDREYELRTGIRGWEREYEYLCICEPGSDIKPLT